MRQVTVVVSIVLIALASTASAEQNTSAIFDMDEVAAQKDALIEGGGSSGSFVGGDTIANALPIPAIPFYDTGNTCDYNDDYDEACPFTGSTAPDVVYSYSPASDIALIIDLCPSGYDTKVYVYDDGLSVLACNDDAGCPLAFRSKIDYVFLPGGGTYYIVVDGYGTSCGDYDLTITEWEPCAVLTCPEGGTPEGEPECYDGYDDMYNGGCNSFPEVFQSLTPSCEMITICGTSGTFVTDGWSTRDTDWFEMIVEEESQIEVCCTAEFPLQLITLDGSGGCSGVEIDYARVGCGDTACLTHLYLPGTYWIWVGPSVFEGYGCGADYILTIQGYHGTGASATQSTQWSMIKSLFD
jgi:hypothetical protein